MNTELRTNEMYNLTTVLSLSCSCCDFWSWIAHCTGSLGLPAELLRYARDVPQPNQTSSPFLLAGLLTAFLSGMLRSGLVPVACNQALVTPTFKRGSRLDTDNYRPNAVTEPLMRLYAANLSARLHDYTESDDLRASTQEGLCPGHSVLHPIFTLHYIMQRQQHHEQKLFICLLDLGAYDRVSRPFLCTVLQRLSVHGVMLVAIQAMYASAIVSVPIGGRSGPILPSRTGVHQGCPSSPIGLLADGLHTVLQGVAVTDGVALSAGCVLSELAYADDFVLMSPTTSSLQILIDASSAWCATVGMQPSPAKTVCMELTSPDSPAFHCTCAGHDLRVVSETKYLGVSFAPGVSVVPVLQQRRARMCGAFAVMKRQYGNLGCAQSEGLCLQLFVPFVQSVGSFACDWGLLPLTGVAKKQRAAIVTTHLGMVKEVAVLSRITPTHVVHADLDEMLLDSIWLLRAAKLWNALVAGSSFYACMLKDDVALSHLRCRDWVTGLKHKLASVGYVSDLEADAHKISTQCASGPSCVRLRMPHDRTCMHPQNWPLAWGHGFAPNTTALQGHAQVTDPSPCNQ